MCLDQLSKGLAVVQMCGTLRPEWSWPSRSEAGLSTVGAVGPWPAISNSFTEMTWKREGWEGPERWDNERQDDSEGMGVLWN